MTELVERVRANSIARFASTDGGWTDNELDDAARAAIEAVFAWLEKPSDAALQAVADNLFGARYDDWTEDAREVWSAILAQLKREALED